MSQKRNKAIIFHQFLAPYRIDFFNACANLYDIRIFFSHDHSHNHRFDQEEMKLSCNFEPHYLKHVKIGKRILPLEVFSILKNLSPQIVFVPEFSILSAIVCFFRFVHKSKFKIISICDDSIDMIQGNELSRYHAVARKMILPLLDDIVLLDAESCKWYQQRHGKGVFFPIIRNERLLEEKYRSALPVSIELNEQFRLYRRKVILYVGRLAPEKNLSLLIEGVASMNDKVSLVLVGCGEEEKKLNQLSIRLGCDVIFTGWLNGEKLTAWFNIADIFVLPSLVEPFGAVINEALVAGCYCLVSNRCGSACLIEEKINGELFDPVDENQFKDVLARTLKKFESKKRDEIVLKKNLMPFKFKDSFDNLMTYLQKH